MKKNKILAVVASCLLLISVLQTQQRRHLAKQPGHRESLYWE